MKHLAALLLLILSSQTMAEVLSLKDDINGCDRKIAINSDSNDAEIRTSYSKLRAEGAEIVSLKKVYGLSLRNLKVDFDNRNVQVNIVQRVILGINVNLVNGATIEETNPNFGELINQLNYDIMIMREVCIDQKGNIVYGK